MYVLYSNTVFSTKCAQSIQGTTYNLRIVDGRHSVHFGHFAAEAPETVLIARFSSVENSKVQIQKVIIKISKLSKLSG